MTIFFVEAFCQLTYGLLHLEHIPGFDLHAALALSVQVWVARVGMNPTVVHVTHEDFNEQSSILLFAIDLEERP